jgi:limonene-1,2-epoxide hydrolase
LHSAPNFNGKYCKWRATVKTTYAMLRLLVAALVIGLAPAAFATDANQMAANKKAVEEFLDLAINQKNFEAAAKFLGPRYVQHNPNAADGQEGLKAYIAFLRQKFPDYHSDIKRVFADGDYVIRTRITCRALAAAGSP